MLVLKMNLQDEAVIDLREHGLGLVRVMLLASGRGIARLGFEADKSVPIHRKAVFEKREAAKP